jgi:DNA-binding PadR family transcriptional regulator
MRERPGRDPGPPRRRRHDPFGPETRAFGAEVFRPFVGAAGPFGRFAFGRGPRVKRGDVRAAALLLLADAPRNGYQLMQEIESRSGGVWRPSPGSIYPVLQQLEDEGLVRPVGPEGRRVYELTDDGRAHVDAHLAELGSPWSAVADAVGENAADYHGLMVQLVVAARQVAHVGSPQQVAEASELLAQTRRRLYRILADDAGEDEPGPAHEERP